MRSKGILILLVAVFTSACGEDSTRRLPNGNNPNPQNPNLGSGSDAFTIKLIARLENNGVQTYSITASLVDAIRNSASQWSNEGILGSQFMFSMGPLLVDVPMVYNANTKHYELLNPLVVTSGSAFQSLHNKELTLTRLGSSNQTLSNNVRSPLVLGSYPLLNVPTLPNRILSNCNPLTQAPDFITWIHQSFEPIKINFYLPPETLKLPVTALDSTSWQMTANVFEAFYSAAEILELETPNPPGVYGSDVKEIRLSIARKAAGSFNVGAYTMPVEIYAIQDGHYMLEYRGGCQ